MAANESTTTIRINYDAKEAERGLKALKSSFNALAGSAAVAGVISFLKDARRESQEYKLAVNQLTAGLGYYSTALIKQANVLEKTKYIDAAELLQAQARLSFYFKEENEIKKLTPAVIELARAKGIDLVSAANLLAVAFSRSQNAAKNDEGQIRGLGIEFTKTGDRAKDLDAMIKSVTDKMGGQAQAVYDSLDGWDKLGFKIRQVKEELGKLLFGVSKNEQKEIDIAAKESLLRETRLILQNVENNTTGVYIKNKEKSIELIKQHIAEYEKEIKTYYDEQKALKEAAIINNKYEKAGLTAEDREKIERERKKKFLDRLEWEVWELKKAEDEKAKIRAGQKLSPQFKDETAINTQIYLENLKSSRERINQLEEEGIKDESERIDKKAQKEIDYWLARIGRTEEFTKLEKAILENAANEKAALVNTNNTAELELADQFNSLMQSFSDRRFNRELNNLDRKKLGEKKYNKEREKILKEQEQQEKTFARIQQAIILGQTIMNISKGKGVATSKGFFGLPEWFFVAAQGALEIATIQAQHFQRGYLGEVDRSRRGDNMQAMIGSNEAVIPGPQYAMHQDDVKAIVNNTANTAAGMRALRGGSVVHNYYGLSSEQVIAVQRDAERRKYTGRLI